MHDFLKQLDLLDLLHVATEYNKLEQIMHSSP